LHGLDRRDPGESMLHLRRVIDPLRGRRMVVVRGFV
jgi:hypothetical protein